ncbi:hypothetical protein [Halosimplex sp. TS25]|uniref:hypothetical protein n=1 Tax=Halosimplex rarum TaxID=3396619 RepID=UPI0039E79394
MSLREVSRYVLRYTVVAAGATVALLFGVAAWAEFPLQLLTMILLVPAMAGSFLVLRGTDMEMETAAAGVDAGFVPDDPNSLRAGLGALPGQYAVGFFLVGLGVDALLAVGVVSVLT